LHSPSLTTLSNDPASFTSLAVPTSCHLTITLNSSPVSPGNSRSHWSSGKCSPHFLLSPCKQEVTQSPAVLSSDGVRAEMGVKSGLHVWKVLWNPNHRGSHAVMGISRHECPLQASEYNVLVGRDSQSWGWVLKTNQLWHGGHKAPLPIPERILLVPVTLGMWLIAAFWALLVKASHVGWNCSQRSSSSSYNSEGYSGSQSFISSSFTGEALAQAQKAVPSLAKCFEAAGNSKESSDALML
uniref:Uncharacterized protein n=1 Tax=Mastacembelus armatus TaxID=205130 RepID=A0A3Q3LWC6_9TELE